MGPSACMLGSAKLILGEDFSGCSRIFGRLHLNVVPRKVVYTRQRDRTLGCSPGQQSRCQSIEWNVLALTSAIHISDIWCVCATLLSSDLEKRACPRYTAMYWAQSYPPVLCF